MPIAALAMSLAACGGGSGGTPATYYTLSVQKWGTGTGMVSGGGISCGATCSASIASGTAVALTPSADAGSTFAGWLGCDGWSGTTCTLTMDADRVVTGTFSLNPAQYTLTVAKSGSGTVAGGGGAISCGTTCSAPFDYGTPVTVTATPDANWTFGGWAGCDSVSGPTCNVTMNAGRNVTATFTRVQYTLTVAKSGTGGGTVAGGGGVISCGTTCSGSFDAGTPVTLMAVPDAGSILAGWTGCDTASGPTCSVTMNGSRTVTATFSLGQYTLTVQKGGTGGGTVAGGGGAISCGATCSASFDSGTQLALTATPDATSTFASWAGCDSASGTTCNVTMGANRAVTATFTRVQYTLTVSKSGTGGGTVAGGGGAISCGATCSAPFDSGTQVALTAAPDANSTFGGWVGCDAATGPTCNVTMTASRTVTATFTLNPVLYTLTVAKSGTGTGTVSGGGISCGTTCSASLPYGTAVALVAAAAPGSTFMSWGGCASVSPDGLTCNVTMTADRIVTATFEQGPRLLMVQKLGGGTGTVTGAGGAISCGTTCSASLPYGTAVTLVAAAAPGSTFMSWTGCASVGPDGLTCNVTMTADRIVTATFEQGPRLLTVQRLGGGTGTVSGAGGAISCGTTCSASLPYGTAVALVAAAAPGSTLAGWAGCASTSPDGLTCNVTMTADRVVTASFNPVVYTLAVAKSGTGTGTVTGGGGAITCGATCSASFDSGTPVMLTAVADANSTFGGWTGCDTWTGATCSVTMSGNRTVTATFTLNPVLYTLTVGKSGTGTGTVSGGGVSCGAACSASLASGTAVALTAVADTGSTFGGWTGCDTWTGATCSVTMSGNRTVTATFTLNPVLYTLTVAKSGTGAGTVTGGGGAISCGATCSASLVSGTPVTLTASPDVGSAFGGWVGCETATGPTCNVTMNASRTVTATFNPVMYTLNVVKSGTGTGTVTSGGAINCGATCSTTLAYGTAVTLTASPDVGSTFGVWVGCDTALGPTCNLTMTGDRIVTATFIPVVYALTVAKGGTGTGTVTGGGGAISCGATCNASFDSGTPVALTATPDATSTFGSWAGCDSVSGATCNVTMTASRTVTATFNRVQYTLSVLKGGTGGGTVAGGSINCGPTCGASFDSGTPVALTATPDATSTFVSWAGCDSTSGATCNVTMTANRTVTATFNRVQYTLTVAKNGTGAGTVTSGGAISCGAICNTSLDSGTPVVLTATPDATSTFVSWTGCDSTSGGTCNVTMTANRTVTATFTRVQYTLTVAKSGTGAGTVTSGGAISCGATCNASLDSGTPVALTPTPDATSTFVGWTGCDSTSGSTCNVTMTANRTVTATFSRVQYTLSVLKGGTGVGTVAGGSINCGPTCGASFDSGTPVVLTATPDATSTFGNWTGCDSTSGATCNVTMTANRTVTATFNPVMYTLSVVKSGTGTGTVTSGGAISCGAICYTSLDAGTPVTLSATPDANSTFGSWAGCDSASGATCNVTMNASRTVTATFDAPGSLYVVNSTAYTITQLYVSPAGAGTWGQNQLISPISPSGSFTLTGIPVGTYDFRAVASDGITFWQTNSVAITAGGQSTWTLLPPAVGSLNVVNNTSYSITELYVSLAGSGTWGPNQLVPPQSIAPSGTFTLTAIPVGTYDFLAVAADGFSYWLTTSVSITDGGLATWTLQPPAVGSLLVVNNHCLAVTDLYLAPSGSPTWSPNQLLVPIDPPGPTTPAGTFTLTGIPVGTYDAYALGIDGTYWATNGIPITMGGAFPWNLYMPAGTGCLTVVNNTPTSDTIDLLYDPPSPSGCTGNNWGTERLGGVIMLPGASFTLGNVSPGAHDLRASGFTALLDPSNYVACGAGIQAGGTVYWYLGGPP
ncbi:MAG TPA: hypothetical protein VFR85_12580 [Anaeromyxobacteraceae bacterium]|nr:hypothetical protein [Anaeromyxobacteraceae bacterium]